VFKTRAVPKEIGGFATTLLASVERCSRCWTSQGTTAGCEHGSTLASSVVAEDVARGGTAAGSEHGSTLASSVVAEGVARGGAAAGCEHGSTLASSVVAEGAARGGVCWL